MMVGNLFYIQELVELGVQKVGHRKKILAALTNITARDHLFSTKPVRTCILRHPNPHPPPLHTYTHPMSPSLHRLVSLSGCPCWGWHSTSLCCWTQVMMTLTSSRISLLRSSETSTSLKRVSQGYGCICMVWCPVVVGETS